LNIYDFTVLQNPRLIDGWPVAQSMAILYVQVTSVKYRLIRKTWD